MNCEIYPTQLLASSTENSGGAVFEVGCFVSAMIIPIITESKRGVCAPWEDYNSMIMAGLTVGCGLNSVTREYSKE